MGSGDQTPVSVDGLFCFSFISGVLLLLPFLGEQVHNRLALISGREQLQIVLDVLTTNKFLHGGAPRRRLLFSPA
jgi:hypothetical protein